MPSRAAAADQEHRTEAEQNKRRAVVTRSVAAARAAVVGARPTHAAGPRGETAEPARARARHRIAAGHAVLVAGAIVAAAARGAVAVARAWRAETSLRAGTRDADAGVADLIRAGAVAVVHAGAAVADRLARHRSVALEVSADDDERVCVLCVVCRCGTVVRRTGLLVVCCVFV